MSKRRKHRVMLEVTFAAAISAKQATHIMQDVMDSSDLDKLIGANYWADQAGAYITKVRAKEGNRVILAESRINR